MLSRLRTYRSCKRVEADTADFRPRPFVRTLKLARSVGENSLRLSRGRSDLNRARFRYLINPTDGIDLSAANRTVPPGTTTIAVRRINLQFGLDPDLMHSGTNSLVLVLYTAVNVCACLSRGKRRIRARPSPRHGSRALVYGNGLKPSAVLYVSLFLRVLIQTP